MAIETGTQSETSSTNRLEPRPKGQGLLRRAMDEAKERTDQAPQSDVDSAGTGPAVSAPAQRMSAETSRESVAKAFADAIPDDASGVVSSDGPDDSEVFSRQAIARRLEDTAQDQLFQIQFQMQVLSSFNWQSLQELYVSCFVTLLTTAGSVLISRDHPVFFEEISKLLPAAGVMLAFFLYEAISNCVAGGQQVNRLRWLDSALRKALALAGGPTAPTKPLSE